MNIGDTVRFKPKHREARVTGQIAWIHPARRYALVEFRVQTPLGLSPVMRECFLVKPNGTLDTK